MTETVANAQACVQSNTAYHQCDNVLIQRACHLPVWLLELLPVYICTDKTKKAIDVRSKVLFEADGLKVTSVKKFIELTEMIAGIL